MTYPWEGAGRPVSPEAFDAAAARIGCDVAAIRAVWDVEAAGRGFLRDGSLVRRLEPHHMPRETWARLGFDPAGKAPWRASLKIGPTRREAMLLDAYGRDPEAACAATSWGGPQIMGFNAGEAGFVSAQAMVRAMAASEAEQVKAFVTLILSWGLDSAMRGHDWQTFETRYNGGGFGGKYARKIEAAYRKHSGGRVSPSVLRIGSSGASVRALQEALQIEADGVFGPQTQTAVRSFQEGAGLPADGIVGKRTWAALEQGDTKPDAQPTPADDIADRAIDYARKGGPGVLVGGGGTWFFDRAPEGAQAVLFYGVVGIGLLIGAAVAAAVVRRVVWGRA